MASLYKDLARSGIPTDHHESDLYVLDTPEARETIKKYGYKFTTFTSNVDGKRWIDVPFAYEPFWEKKQQAQRGAPSGKRTVEAATSKRRSHATISQGYYLLYWPFGRSPKTELPGEHWGPFAAKEQAKTALKAQLDQLKKGGYDAKDLRSQYQIKRLTSAQFKDLFPWSRGGY